MEGEAQVPVQDTKVLEAEQLVIEEFNKGLKELLAKFPQFGLGATAFLLPDGRVGARPTLMKLEKEETKVEEKPALSEG